MSVPCKFSGEVLPAILKISGGLNVPAATKALSYLEDELKPVKDQVTKTLLEAVFTQIVFFYVILLIVLLICILWCCWVTNMSAVSTFCIMIAVVIITVIFVAILSFYVIDQIRSNVDFLLFGITRADLLAEKSKIETVINSAAQVYLDSLINP